MIEKYIITSATNNALVFEKGLEALENYAYEENATLIVLPVRYNPKKLSQDEIIYDKKVELYIKRNNFSINNLLSVLPEVNISPTAIKPLQGLASLGNESHTLVAHPRMHLDTIPTMDKMHPKFILTTGSITQENYTISKLGAKADFHHTYGAVIVEIDSEDKRIFFRQVSIDNDGEFYDIDKKYNYHSVEKTNAEAIVYGDIHELFLADIVRDKGLFGKDSLAKICNPSYVVYHDLLDQFTESHHNQNSPFRKYMIATEKINIIQEIDRCKIFIEQTLSILDAKPIIISSNHNSHLTQWLERADWKAYPSIAREVLNMNLMMLDEIDANGDMDAKIPDLFRLIMLKEFGDEIIALDYNENLKLNSFEISLHGDKGVNGARTLGNIQNHINTKLIKAHGHSANRVDGVLTVGTSSRLDRNYTFGLGTWSHTHSIVHKNNKAQLITQHPIDGEFRINKKANSRGKLIVDMKRDDFTPHFTQAHQDVIQKENGMKYRITTPEGDIIYSSGYRGIAEITELTERQSQTLMVKGEWLGHILEKL